MTEFDSPWKEAIDLYFKAFMELCCADLNKLVDWSVPPKMLDKELQQIAQVSDTGLRIVDKLVEVRLLTGEIEWLLIHLEIQSQWSSNFAERMFVYYYRIRDKYQVPLVSLAVLGDDDPSWRPNRFEDGLFGCKVTFAFPIIKLLDFVDRLSEFEQSTNPFAKVIAAHLMALQTVDSPHDRCHWKLRLIRSLYALGFSANDVRSLFRVIDWMMNLPVTVALVFEHELRKIEQEYQMPYVTSIEQRAIEKGREEGREEGSIGGKIQLLQTLLGEPEVPLPELLQRPIEELRTEMKRLQSLLVRRSSDS